ncbi:MAG: hypothetical protein H8E72_08265 [Candidatus Marinimicrobia bacterium]|nr:hypothetical protein [Candidatus Neomarinimicrobiota bacterium]
MNNIILIISIFSTFLIAEKWEYSICSWTEVIVWEDDDYRRDGKEEHFVCTFTNYDSDIEEYNFYIHIEYKDGSRTFKDFFGAKRGSINESLSMMGLDSWELVSVENKGTVETDGRKDGARFKKSTDEKANFYFKRSVN